MDWATWIQALLGGFLGAVIGGVLAYFGAVKGGRIQATEWRRLDQERTAEERSYQAAEAVRQRRHEWERKAFEWQYSSEVTSFRHADLQGARLQGIDLGEKEILLGTGRHKVKADLTFADLRGANLTNARLGRADLRYAKLDGAILDGALLNYADLTGVSGATWEQIQTAAKSVGEVTRPDGSKA